MPHLILEYTDNVKEKINLQALFTPCHAILEKNAPTDLSSCKSRAIKQTHFYIGNGAPPYAFVHLTLLLAEGRPLSTRQNIGQQMLKVLEEYFAQSSKELNLQITVEVKELAKGLYFKIPANSI